jgi:acyl carrier protein
VVIDIAAEIRDILVFHLGSEDAKLANNAKLIDDLGADSLDVVEVVMSCEEKFNIEIPNHVATTFVTVGDVVAFVKANAAENHKAPQPTVASSWPSLRAAS